MLFHRHHDAWGKKTARLVTGLGEESATSIEQKIQWSYAGLVELNFGNGLYWSESRVYNSNIQEWMTADPLAQWNATELADKPGNYFPFQYAGNDPLAYIDPSAYRIPKPEVRFAFLTPFASYWKKIVAL